MRRALTPVLTYVAVAALVLLLLWAFVSYLHPSFSGEQAGELLRCG